MLLYRAGRFIQFLEGPEAALRDTMQRIENSDDEETILRAARELTIWFRTRALHAS
ncbi:BLUF domain-containing protein [Microbacterium radiodurans]|uniref:BLUF domain-containing protein n=1 Tax=Microbacterium radiodurans TaxID=661398 RepID=A0A5J5ISD9_9MICO|nr:BLUF domain-containing protein [Microbacterium radiodurans]KAA9084146.1 hypothetical protein F6B42_14295 [Microbacterium radiodurans]